MNHYQSRIASPQAWRRLRKAMSDQELKDITEDIVNVLSADITEIREMDPDAIHNVSGTILFALASKSWDKTT